MDEHSEVKVEVGFAWTSRTIRLVWLFATPRIHFHCQDSYRVDDKR